jgi:hypothetical protein
LDPFVHIALAPQLDGNEVLDKLVIRASNVAHAIEQACPHDHLQAMQSSPTMHTMSKRPASNNPGNAPLQYLRKLSDVEREFLRSNDGCFSCHKPNAGHISYNYPEAGSWAKKEVQVKKESVDVISIAAESELSDSYSCSSSPTIIVKVQVQNIPVKALTDSGSTVNVLSSDIIKRRRLRIQTNHPVSIRQALHPKGFITMKKLVSKVSIHPNFGRVPNQQNLSLPQSRTMMSSLECHSWLQRRY